MGSSFSSTSWVLLAAISGVLYLAFDAARYFANHLSPMRLRRWSSDPHFQRGGRWFQYDPQNFQLVSGAVLQICLTAAVGFTALAFGRRGPVGAVLIAVGLWVAVVMAWKFVLAIVPDEIDEALLHALIPISHIFYYVFWPLLFPLRLLLERMEREVEEEQDDEEVTEEEVQAYIDVGEEEGILEGTEGDMVQSIVDFGDRMARELMTPRIDVLAFDVSQPFEQLARLFSESKYSRIPLYSGSVDTITGVVHIKDVFDSVLKGQKPAVSDLARPALFVPETKKVSELLREFQSEKLAIAVVVDEYGGTAGVITIEDIVEDIVGDISDEHEDEEAPPIALGDDTYLVAGKFRVKALEEIIETPLADEGYETVAGLIFTTLGRVPKAGEVVTHNGVRFEVDRADRKRIYRVKVTRLPKEEGDEEGE
jgi:CBS domain containing-hemolysin-like protein